MGIGINIVLKTILALVLVIGETGIASALSCTPYEQRYFMLCDTKGCHAAFGVAEVKGFSGCSRRPVVEEIDKEVEAHIGRLIIEIYPDLANGLFRLTVAAPSWRPDTPGNTRLERLVEDLDELRGTHPSDRPVGTCSTRTVSVAGMGALFLKLGDKNPLVLVTDVNAARVVDSTRSAFESEASYQYWKSLVFEVAHWASIALASIASVYSIYLFHARPSARSAAVMIQLTISVLGVVAVLLAWFGMSFGVFLIPVVMLTLLFEATARKFTKRADRTVASVRSAE